MNAFSTQRAIDLALRKDRCWLYVVRVTRQRKINDMVSKLLEWYPEHARDLPWRKRSEPYGVFVSEIMLQQTQVKTVIRYWQRWMQVLPDVASLASASADLIHKLWEGLGYYTRVRNMQKAAQIIVSEHQANFPQTFDEVLELPGIGRYTAGAICSIAFNQPRPILDGNVMRVLTRVFGIRTDPKEPRTNSKLWQLAEALVLEAALAQEPAHRAMNGNGFRRKAERRRSCSELNQALMEVGATICTPREPHCHLCPVAAACVARREGLAAILPRIAPRPKTTARRFVAFVAERNGQFLVRQRPVGVVNAHLWEFPNVETPVVSAGPVRAARAIFGTAMARCEPLCTIKHSITRYRMTLEAFRIAPPGAEVEGRWVKLRDLEKLAFTSAHKKILQRLS